MSGIRKVAIALMTLDQLSAPKLMAGLPRECAAAVSAEMHRLGKLSREEVQEVEGRFQREVAELLLGWTKEA
ncbi:MAG: hypothetical protein HYZ53_29240 [Planctomycetes bacterium]|nr:hypothetical protein [Planctomycetota bacterium]